jgi:hypothetical protein
MQGVGTKTETRFLKGLGVLESDRGVETDIFENLMPQIQWFCLFSDMSKASAA